MSKRRGSGEPPIPTGEFVGRGEAAEPRQPEFPTFRKEAWLNTITEPNARAVIEIEMPAFFTPLRRIETAGRRANSHDITEVQAAMAGLRSNATVARLDPSVAQELYNYFDRVAHYLKAIVSLE